jgi:RNA polymerase sigma-70 factor (ECF subfamily)
MVNADQGEPGDSGDSGKALTDSSLLRRLRQGNQDAATQLYLRYAERLRQLAQAECSAELARRVDVDDIVQSVFISFFRGVSQGYYHVPAGEELWKLFLVIALNKIRSKAAFHRAAKRDVRLTVGEHLIDTGSKSSTDSDPNLLTFLRLVVDDVLAQLPEQQGQMIRLRIDGFEVAEIAARTGRSKRTVERVLQEFRKRLGTLLQEEK